VEAAEEDGEYEVREPAVPCRHDFAPRNSFLRLNNTYFLNAYPDILIRVLGPTPTEKTYRNCPLTY